MQAEPSWGLGQGCYVGLQQKRGTDSLCLPHCYRHSFPRVAAYPPFWHSNPSGRHLPSVRGRPGACQQLISAQTLIPPQPPPTDPEAPAARHGGARATRTRSLCTPCPFRLSGCLYKAATARCTPVSPSLPTSSAPPAPPLAAAPPAYAGAAAVACARATWHQPLACQVLASYPHTRMLSSLHPLLSMPPLARPACSRT